MQTLSQIAAELKQCQTFVIATHTSPDPDAIGSACGLASGLLLLGKSVQVYLGDDVPRIMQQLVQGLPIVSVVPASRVDAVVVVDTAGRRRIGGDGDTLLTISEKTFNIDHHISNDAWAKFNHINAERSSCAEIVQELLEELQVKFDVRTSNLLFAGTMDDTGSFRYRNTSAATFANAARLVGYGASPQHVSNLLYFSVPPHVVRLHSRALSQAQFFAEGRVAAVAVPQALLDECGATAEDTDGIVEAVRGMEGVLVAVFMRELSEGWKFSLRAKTDQVDVNAIAAVFGGGGHKAAAGCRVLGTERAAQQAVLEQVIAAVAKL